MTADPAAYDLDAITVAFGAFNLLRLASYFPQILAVARDGHGATAISFSCWTIWVGANASTGLYAWVKLGDANLALVSGFNAGCCLAVLVLAAYKRISASMPTVAHCEGPRAPARFRRLLLPTSKMAEPR
jgi:hypothetical protein